MGLGAGFVFGLGRDTILGFAAGRVEVGAVLGVGAGRVTGFGVVAGLTGARVIRGVVAFLIGVFLLVSHVGEWGVGNGEMGFFDPFTTPHFPTHWF